MAWSTLTDGDVWAAADYADVVAAMERALVEHAAGTLLAPPRWRVEVAEEVALVFTAGSAQATGACGFRVYETFPEHSEDHHGLVAVWDADDGRFRGLVVGGAVGVLRTGGIGGVAVDALAREDAATLGVLGSGRDVVEVDAVHLADPVVPAALVRPLLASLAGLAHGRRYGPQGLEAPAPIRFGSARTAGGSASVSAVAADADAAVRFPSTRGEGHRDRPQGRR
jgi:ornithine cyclodeaminase/alanine dehydrogenase